MKDWKQILIGPTAPTLEAVRIISEGALQIALVVNDQGVLLGTVTDGDIRDLLLRHQPLDTPVAEIMCKTPLVALDSDAASTMLQRMNERDVLHIPILNAEGVVVGLHCLKDLVAPARHDNLVVLMAGGLGTRLRPLTETCPKPMLNVGGKPILQTIIESYLDHGFYNFAVCVNYKSEVIKQYFKDGSEWGASIQYIEETKRMGTAGALSLIKEKPSKPFFVMNGDLLTKVNFHHLLEFHKKNNATATICVREYEFQVPFGVVKTNGQMFMSIEEKPKHNFFVNAGIYVLNPSALEKIPNDTFYDMPDLYRRLSKEGHSISCFPVQEYWLDIGRIDDFQKAELEFSLNFTNMQSLRK